MNLKIFCLNLIIDLLLIQTSDERSVLVRDEELPPIDDQIYETPKKQIRTKINAEFFRSDPHFGVMYLRLAIFYDNYLLKRFGDNQKDLKQFVSSIVYTSQIFFNRDNIINFAYFKFLVVLFEKFPGEIEVETMGENETNVGNNAKLLKDFCNYAHSLNSSDQWIGAMLLTGLNIWSKDKGKRKDRDLGMSYQNSVCTDNSCGIVEGREFISANIFSHELGHMLNMNHDGEKGVGCHPHKFIMTAQFSQNRINEWSECSAQQLEDKLRQMSVDKKLKCMQQNVNPVSSEFDFSKQDLPGVVWPIDKQCQFGLGPKYMAINTRPNHDICRSLLCRSYNFWFERKRGFPALEGTYCGSTWANGIELKHYCRSDLCTTKLTAEPIEHRINNNLYTNDTEILTSN